MQVPDSFVFILFLPLKYYFGRKLKEQYMTAISHPPPPPHLPCTSDILRDGRVTRNTRIICSALLSHMKRHACHWFWTNMADKHGGQTWRCRTTTDVMALRNIITGRTCQFGRFMFKHA